MIGHLRRDSNYGGATAAPDRRPEIQAIPVCAVDLERRGCLLAPDLWMRLISTATCSFAAAYTTNSCSLFGLSSNFIRAAWKTLPVTPLTLPEAFERVPWSLRRFYRDDAARAEEGIYVRCCVLTAERQEELAQRVRRGPTRIRTRGSRTDR